MSKEAVFVSRESELARLSRFLDKTMSNSGQTCFVCGVAGSGKTALVTEFARRAQECYAQLLIVVGQCDPQTGVSDPYLPFREILAQLTGDVTPGLAIDGVSVENANRLQRFLAFSGEAIAEVGPDLLGLFVPLGGLLARAGAFAVGKAGWLEKLREQAERTQNRRSAEARSIDQVNIFAQYADVLLAMAKHQPLLLILDDLHWADQASVDLLFRIARRTDKDRVMIIGTYRPDEVALGRGEDRHPLEKVLAELKRYYGEIIIDLDQATEAERRRFVTDFLASEPNHLSDNFCNALFAHTGGHALFTIELLRNMQERGDLILDSQQRWVQGPTLTWEDLPARVEGVIEERVGRLASDLRQALSIGSVEGERFTAEVIARVQPRELLRLVGELGQELEKRHRLVTADGMRNLESSNRCLRMYRFQHNLFRTYLYGELSVAERTLLHEAVGIILEDLYGQASNEMAVQLAHHFVQAGIHDRARHYLHLAGEQAASRYANDEALHYFTHALKLTPETDLVGRYDLLLAREQIFGIQGKRDEQARDLETLQALAEALDDNRRHAETDLRYAGYARITGKYQHAISAAQSAVDCARAIGDVGNEALGLLHWGSALAGQGQIQAARLKYEQALPLTRVAGIGYLEARALRTLGNACNDLGDTMTGKALLEQSLEVCHRINDRREEAGTLTMLACVATDTGDYAAARGSHEQALKLYRELGDRWGEAAVYNNLGCTYYYMGVYEQARAYFEQCRRIRHEIDDQKGQREALNNLGAVCESLSAYSDAETYLQKSLALAKEQSDKHGEAYSLANLGILCLRLGAYQEAKIHLEQGLEVRRTIGARREIGSILVLLGFLHHCMDDDRQAESLCREGLCIAQDIGDRDGQAKALKCLGHAMAGLGHWEEASNVYQESFKLRRELGQTVPMLESLAGLARVTLARNAALQAQIYAEEILQHLDSGTLDGAEDPYDIYLTCYRILEANQDTRAVVLLKQAHQRLVDEATNISDEVKKLSFLSNVSSHHEIMEAWEQVCRQ